MPLINADASIHDTIVEMTEKRLGLVGVTEDGAGEGNKSALFSMGSLVYAHFGQKLPAGAVG